METKKHIENLKSRIIHLEFRSKVAVDCIEKLEKLYEKIDYFNYKLKVFFLITIAGICMSVLFYFIHISLIKQDLVGFGLLSLMVVIGTFAIIDAFNKYVLKTEDVQ